MHKNRELNNYGKITNTKKGDPVRCDCGKLYLVRTDAGYEFKCPRCKQIHLLKYEDIILEYLTKGDDSLNQIKV